MSTNHQKIGSKKKETEEREREVYAATQWQLIRQKFKKHRLARAGIIVLIIFYFAAIFCEFLAPYSPRKCSKYIFAPPQKIHFFDEKGEFHFRPFTYSLKKSYDPETLRRKYTENMDKKNYIHFFVHGDHYKLWNLFEMDIHLFDTKEGQLFLFGTNKLGQDLLSRTIYASRISLSIGLVGVAFSFILGSVLGGISGYLRGIADVIIQRVVAFLISIPKIPLWMALAAALPLDWNPIKIYFSITIILSLIGWTQICRVVRGKIISLREEDYVLAARIAGASSWYIILKHLLPGFLSYLIVSLTLALPSMIIGETALSFLGLGLQPPVVSWGVLLQEAQAVSVIALYPHLLIPGGFVVLVVLAFNFVGDGLRDAADPYK